jgi:hypothetical protein
VDVVPQIEDRKKKFGAGSKKVGKEGIEQIVLKKMDM